MQFVFIIISFLEYCAFSSFFFNFSTVLNIFPFFSYFSVFLAFQAFFNSRYKFLLFYSVSPQSLRQFWVLRTEYFFAHNDLKTKIQIFVVFHSKINIKPCRMKICHWVLQLVLHSEAKCEVDNLSRKSVVSYGLASLGRERCWQL